MFRRLCYVSRWRRSFRQNDTDSISLPPDTRAGAQVKQDEPPELAPKYLMIELLGPDMATGIRLSSLAIVDYKTALTNTLPAICAAGPRPADTLI